MSWCAQGLLACSVYSHVQANLLLRGTACVPLGSGWRGLQVIRIQPDEAIYLKINNKIPGLGLHLDVTKLDLTYRERFEVACPPRGLLHVHVVSL